MSEGGAQCAANGRHKKNAELHDNAHRSSAPCCVCRGSCPILLGIAITMLRRSLQALILFALVFIAYEGYAVYVARKALPQAFAPFLGARTNDQGPSPEQLDLIVRVQDPAFRSHEGIEWPSPLTTTTITQSLVKHLFFDQFRPGFQKIEQTLIAWLVVDPNISKAVQLRAFVETAYFGHKDGAAVIGLDAAAQAWFAKPLKQVTADQFLALVAMLPGPNALLPGSAASVERVGRISRLLAGACDHTRVADIMLEQCKS